MWYNYDEVNKMSTVKDLRGKKFGYLTPISYIKENGKVKWKCKCDCGNETVVISSNLSNGHTKSCGCIMRENLVGEKFGELEVIELDKEKTKYGATYWKCKCSCGNIVSALASKLKSGRRKNCSGYAHDKIVGKKFGRLYVTKDYIKDNSSRRKYLCKCECGNEIYVTSNHLTSGHTTSCGCKLIENRNLLGNLTRTHGMTCDRIYAIWCGIKKRCNNKNDINYLRYGGRGITYCKEWEHFEPFYEWAIRNGYRDDLTIDRIDVNGDYCPENCRWATCKEQSNNTRRNVFIEYKGKRKTLTQWAEEYNIGVSTLYNRYKYMNWSFEDALTTPVGQKRKTEG